MHEKTRQSESAPHWYLRPSPLWWVGQILLTACACFFVFFGTSLLVAAYRLENPFSFIMTFFASNLIILISVVMVVGFVLRIGRTMRAVRTSTRQNADDR